MKYEYANVRLRIMEQISSGEYKSGDRLPSERDLCDKFNVSRVTIRQALSELERDGWIRRVQGKGTFVQIPEQKPPQRFEQLLSYNYSFSEELRKQHVTPSTRVLTLAHIPAVPPLTERLQVESGHMVDVLVRLRLADDMPYAYETSYVPSEYLSGASAEEIAWDGLYNTMQKRSGIRPDKATEVFEAAIAPEAVAEALARKGIIAVMQIDRTASYNGKIVEYCASYVSGDKYRFRVKLE